MADLAAILFLLFFVIEALFDLGATRQFYWLLVPLFLLTNEKKPITLSPKSNTRD